MEKEELTHKIIGCVHQVFNQLGFGFLKENIRQDLHDVQACPGVKYPFYNSGDYSSLKNVDNKMRIFVISSRPGIFFAFPEERQKGLSLFEEDNI
jgi:hypothetical protein